MTDYYSGIREQYLQIFYRSEKPERRDYITELHKKLAISENDTLLIAHFTL